MNEETFGPYNLTRRIACGGMAEIFLASMERGDGFKKQVVVKRILPQFNADPVFVQMFIDEAVVAGRLSHPNIAQIYDFGQVDGVYFMAMEFIDGIDLRQLLKACKRQQRSLTWAETAAIGESAARGLGYAHAFVDDRLGPLNIVHRDISPHNIMVSRAGDVRVMDFGIAKAAARATHTATGMLKGKLAYMAPEQAAGHPVDGRCDQFSLGVVLWECVAGRRLFRGNSDLDLLRRVLAGNVPAVSTIRPDVPEPLDAVIRRCVANKTSDRFATMDEVADALADFRFSFGKAGVVQLGVLVKEVMPKADLSPPKQTLVLPESEEASEPSASEQIVAPTVVAKILEDTKSDALEDDATKSDEPEQGSDADKSIAPTMIAQPDIRANTARDVIDIPPKRNYGVRVGAAVITLLIVAVLAWTKRDALLATQPIRPLEVTEPTIQTTTEITATATEDSQVSPTGLVEAESKEPIPREKYPDLIPVPPTDAPKPIVTAKTKLPARIEAHKPAPPPRTAPPGRITLRSVGIWVEVYSGKKNLGSTPLVNMELPSGPQRLRLVNKAAGIDKTIQVIVPPGDEIIRTIDLSKP